MTQQQQLIKAAQKGDMLAFEKLYHHFAPRLMGVCFRYAIDQEEAKDLLQESFIKIYEKISTYRDGSFEGWIHRIAVNTALDNYRKRHSATYKIEQINEVNTNQVVAEEAILSQINASELLALVQTLPPTYRIVFNLYVFEGYKHHEIAEKLGVSEGTSKSNLSDARKILQKKISVLMYSNGEKYR